MRGASHGWMVMGLSLVMSPVSVQGSLAPKKSLETSSCVCLMVCVEQEIAGVGWGGEISEQWARNEAGHLCILEGRLSALSLRLIPTTTFSTFSLCSLHATLCILFLLFPSALMFHTCFSSLPNAKDVHLPLKEPSLNDGR